VKLHGLGITMATLKMKEARYIKCHLKNFAKILTKLTAAKKEITIFLSIPPQKFII